MPNSTTNPLSEQASSPRLLIADRASLTTFLDGCPHSQTLTAWSLALGTSVLIALGCKQWSCRVCAQAKCRQLAAMTRDAAPTRMLTLTIDPKLWESPRLAFDGTRRQVPVLVSKLREKFGEVEYLRVTELTGAGWPHYHMLVRSGYLPHPVIRDAWAALTGATIVDIRQVGKHWSAYWYLLKYLTKIHKIEWTARHVSYSRGFFPPREPDPDKSLDLQKVTVSAITPINFCLEFLKGATLERVTPSVYRVSSVPAKTEF